MLELCAYHAPVVEGRVCLAPPEMRVSIDYRNRTTKFHDVWVPRDVRHRVEKGIPDPRTERGLRVGPYVTNWNPFASSTTLMASVLSSSGNRAVPGYT